MYFLLNGILRCLCVFGFAEFLIAPIAWVVFVVTQFLLKHSYAEQQREHRRVLRTGRLILAIFFTICVIGPLPQAVQPVLN